jgi:hypothetical protein
MRRKGRTWRYTEPRSRGSSIPERIREPLSSAATPSSPRARRIDSVHSTETTSAAASLLGPTIEACCSSPSSSSEYKMCRKLLLPSLCNTSRSGASMTWHCQTMALQKTFNYFAGRCRQRSARRRGMVPGDANGPNRACPTCPLAGGSDLETEHRTSSFGRDSLQWTVHPSTHDVGRVTFLFLPFLSVLPELCSEEVAFPSPWHQRNGWSAPRKRMDLRLLWLFYNPDVCRIRRTEAG